MCDLPKEDRSSGTEILTLVKSPEFYKGTEAEPDGPRELCDMGNRYHSVSRGEPTTKMEGSPWPRILDTTWSGELR